MGINNPIMSYLMQRKQILFLLRANRQLYTTIVHLIRLKTGFLVCGGIIASINLMVSLYKMFVG